MNDTNPTPEVALAEQWDQLEDAIDAREGDRLVALLHALPPQDTAYTISHLDPDRRNRMFSLLATVAPELGADLMEHFDDAHAADMLEELTTEDAAALIDEMDSDEQADVLGEVAGHAATAILAQMDPEEAQDVRKRLDFPHDTAGGLMITEFLVYPAEQDVSFVRQDLRLHSDKYNEYEVRYLYGVDERRRLVGVAPMRALVMAHAGRPLREALIEKPITIAATTPLSELEDLFDRVDLMAVPVVDEENRLIGVVRRAAVQEAITESAQEALAKFGGIIGGEELRSMPLWNRAARRLAFLLPILLLLFISASIIALFEGTVGKLPILAAFLPVVAGICGSGGGQSVAVSMREISLGLIKPSDLFPVLLKEASVAVFNGLILGALLFVISLAWQQNFWLSVVLGASLPIVMVVAKGVGGTVPLILRKFGIDPAMASVPLLTTTVDLASFLTVLIFAELAMNLISP